jgi:hypothetical protein
VNQIAFLRPSTVVNANAVTSCLDEDERLESTSIGKVVIYARVQSENSRASAAGGGRRGTPHRHDRRVGNIFHRRYDA